MLWMGAQQTCRLYIRELKQQRRRWQLRKHHLKSEVELIPSRSIRQMLAIISGVEF